MSLFFAAFVDLGHKLIINIYYVLKNHLDKYDLWSSVESVYFSFHSTGTALLRVQNDLVNSISKKNLEALVLLDLNAAFDTIDHNILFCRMSV